MNANQLINMVVRMVLRRLMRTGVDAGIGAFSRRTSKGGQTDAPPPDGKEAQKRARSTMKIARRMGRM